MSKLQVSAMLALILALSGAGIPVQAQQSSKDNSSSKTEKTLAGGAVGAAGGALLGAIVGGNAAVGAAVGGGVGLLVGHMKASDAEKK